MSGNTASVAQTIVIAPIAGFLACAVELGSSVIQAIATPARAWPIGLGIGPFIIADSANAESRGESACFRNCLLIKRFWRHSHGIALDFRSAQI